MRGATSAWSLAELQTSASGWHPGGEGGGGEGGGGDGEGGGGDGGVDGGADGGAGGAQLTRNFLCVLPLQLSCHLMEQPSDPMAVSGAQLSGWMQ